MPGYIYVNTSRVERVTIAAPTKQGRSVHVPNVAQAGLAVTKIFLESVCYQVKNKLPADVQITAEWLLREAKERLLEAVKPVSIRNDR